MWLLSGASGDGVAVIYSCWLSAVDRLPSRLMRIRIVCTCTLPFLDQHRWLCCLQLYCVATNSGVYPLCCSVVSLQRFVAVNSAGSAALAVLCGFECSVISLWLWLWLCCVVLCCAMCVVVLVVYFEVEIRSLHHHIRNTDMSRVGSWTTQSARHFPSRDTDHMAQLLQLAANSELARLSCRKRNKESDGRIRCCS